MGFPLFLQIYQKEVQRLNEELESAREEVAELRTSASMGVHEYQRQLESIQHRSVFAGPFSVLSSHSCISLQMWTSATCAKQRTERAAVAHHLCPPGHYWSQIWDPGMDARLGSISWIPHLLILLPFTLQKSCEAAVEFMQQKVAEAQENRYQPPTLEWPLIPSHMDCFFFVFQVSGFYCCAFCSVRAGLMHPAGSSHASRLECLIGSEW